MLSGIGSLGDVIELARVGLASRDRILADADTALIEALSDASSVAVTAVQRIDAMRADIEEAVATRATDTPEEAREFARSLIVKQRELTQLIGDTQRTLEAKMPVLQRLNASYKPA